MAAPGYEDRGSRRLKILHLEDQPNDVELVRAMLEREGYDLDLDNVVTRDAFMRALDENEYDLILSDFSLPAFDGLSALAMSLQKAPYTPYIFVSGTLGEERAIESLTNGATDYVLKTRMERLGPTVARALKEAKERNERREVQKRLAEAERRFRYLVNSSPSVIYARTADKSHRCTFVSDNFTEVTGYQSREITNNETFWYDHVHPDDRRPALRAVEKHLKEGGRGVIEYRFEHADGGYRWIRDNYRLVADNPEVSPEIVGSWTDITKARELTEDLSYKTSHDALTDLINRQEFERILRHRVIEACKYKHNHTLCSIDIDRFKLINETCGHLAGDELLRQFAKLLQGIVRKRDILARLGSNQFGVIMDFCILDQAMRLAEEIGNAVAGFRFQWTDKVFDISASIGLAQIDEYSESAVQVLKNADEACFTAKETGGGRVQPFDEMHDDLLKRREQMVGVSLINEALDKQRFCLFYQSIVSIEGKKAGDHYEILLRMRDKNGNYISPAMFIPAAERYYLIGKIDKWVIDNLFKWLHDNPEVLQTLSMCSVNISGNSILEEGLENFIFDRLDKHEIPASKVCFEVTETAAIANLAKAQHFIEKLRGHGCHFALDDFGSGMSSFAYLKNLPVDFVKIDGAFVKNMTKDKTDLAMVRAINDIGHVTGKLTIAEFVEDDNTLELLKDLHVDFAQGYAIEKPRPVEDLIETKRQ